MTSVSVAQRPFFRTRDDLRVHRQELYRRTAPVFERYGYRGATMKQLAAACGLSIPALYRYFPSKRDLALYPLSADNRPDGDCFARASADPLVQLRLWLDHAAWEREDFLLGLRLSAAMGDEGRLSDEHLETFRFHISLVSAVLRAGAPRLPEQRARDLIETLLAMSVGADAIGRRWLPATARRRFIECLLPDLLRAGAPRAGLAAALSDPHPAHGPCSIKVVQPRDFVDNAANRSTEAVLIR